MSGLSITPYFPFRRIRILKQAVKKTANKTVIDAVPDKRFHPVCHLCGQKVASVHSWTQRCIRDLNLATMQVWIRCEYRKLFCGNCQRISIEELELFHPYLRVTRRLATYIHHLCKVMTVSEVAQHLQLDWKTVKEIDKQYLEAQYGQPHYEGLRILAVDEISLKKGHKYSSLCSTMRPAYITASLFAYWAMRLRLWVIRSIDVFNSFCISTTSSMIWACTVTSRAVVGSSAIIRSGCMIKAMAIMTR